MKTPSIQELADFTLDSYTNLLQYLSDVYKIGPFCEARQQNDPYLILRHDIDYSLPLALKMAYIERDLGIKSTYFALFGTSSYNLLEDKDASILKEISDFGHEIGLHYYPRRYQSCQQNPMETLHTEIMLLKKITGKKVCSISRHGPWDRDPFASIRGYINANHPYYRSDLFIHDSCRAWTPLEDLIKLLRAPQRRAQILTHPDNWQEDKIDRETLLERITKHLPEKEKTKKNWLTDPLVIKYDHLINDEKLHDYNERDILSSKPKNGFMKEIEYYNKLIRWHLVNTSAGWRFHRMISKIRNG